MSERRGDGARNIRDLLARYARLRAPQGAVIEVVRGAIQDLAHISVEKREVSYSPYTKTVHLRIAGPKKQEIIFAREKILSLCRERLGDKNAPKAIV